MCDKTEYPLCTRCKNLNNNYSSIFGDAFTCTKNVSKMMFIMDNDWTVEEENGEPTPCKEYEFGDPNTVVLG